MKKKNDNAFTLIEMLVVVVLIGIVLAIAIPSSMRLINGHKKQQYETYMDIVEQSTKLYIDQHKGELSNRNVTCFELEYDTLMTETNLKETDVFCSGSIRISKPNGNDEFQYDFYLTCHDKNNNSLNTSQSFPSGCTKIQ